jgi:hypothetical protein
MLESLRSEPMNWPLRMDSIRMIALADPSKAEEQFAAVLDLPATLIPAGARLDALQGLQNVAFETGDYRRAIAMNDRWLASAGFRPSPLPPDAWRTLAVMPLPTQKEVKEAEPDFVSIALAAKFHLAVLGNDLALARETAEQFLAYRLRTGYPQTVRDWLQDIADAEVTAGDRAGATRILGYLSTQPQDPLLTSMLQNLRRKLSSPQGPLIELKPAESPWDETRPPPKKVEARPRGCASANMY